MTIGIGPWLLAGLIPAAIGIGLMIAHYLQEGRSEDDRIDGDEERRAPRARYGELAQGR